MGIEHDKLIMKLDKDLLRRLLVKKFLGEQNVWTSKVYQDMIRLDIKDWKLNNYYIQEPRKQTYNNTSLLSSTEQFGFLDDSIVNLGELKEELKRRCNIIAKASFENSVKIERTIEYPLVKGEGQYKTTKGYVDIIMHIKSSFLKPFSCYKESNKIFEFIIEVKTKKDLKDIGAIVRQINNYKQYYVGWNSKLCSKPYLDEYERHFVLIVEDIGDDEKKMIEDADIILIKINDIEHIKLWGKE